MLPSLPPLKGYPFLLNNNNGNIKKREKLGMNGCPQPILPPLDRLKKKTSWNKILRCIYLLKRKISRLSHLIMFLFTMFLYDNTSHWTNKCLSHSRKTISYHSHFFKFAFYIKILLLVCRQITHKDHKDVSLLCQRNWFTSDIFYPWR